MEDKLEAHIDVFEVFHQTIVLLHKRLDHMDCALNAIQRRLQVMHNISQLKHILHLPFLLLVYPSLVGDVCKSKYCKHLVAEHVLLCTYFDIPL